jgi:hypothetical protein
VSKAFTLSTGLTGRNARGRIFFAGVPIVGLDNATHVTQDFLDDVIEALQALKTIIEALGWIWVIVSRYRDGEKLAVANTYAVTQFTVSNLTTDSAYGRLPKT